MEKLRNTIISYRRITTPSFAAVLIIFTSLACARQTLKSSSGEIEAKDWNQFSSPEGRFQVSAPGQLEEVSKQVTTQSRQISMHAFVLKAPSTTYMITYIDYPQNSTDPSTIARGFDNGRDRALATGGGRLLSENELSLNGVPGREIVVKETAGVTKSRMYYVDDRLYQVVLAIQEPSERSDGIERLNDSAANQFFNSFRITERLR